MKNRILNLIKKAGWILPIAAILMFDACKKNNYLGYTPGTGTPTITSVHTWGRTDSTVRYDTVISYDAQGNKVTTYKQLPFPIKPFDSATTAGNVGTFYIINGTNLGTATSVTFNGIAAFLNRAWNTDNSILVSIPGNTPSTGPRATDNLTVTTTHGQVSYKFVIISPPPIVNTYSDFDFTSKNGFKMTLNGVGFAAVSAVTLKDTVAGQTGSSAVNIVSQNDSVMVLSFPASTVSRGILFFDYKAGANTATSLGKQELVNIDNAYQIFAGGGIAPGWGSWSYDNTAVSNAQTITGPASYNMQYSANGYKIDGLRNGGGTAADGVPYSSSYTYLVFYVYGGTAQETMYVDFGGGPGGGFGNDKVKNGINAVTVLPNRWNYFKIPISTLLWNTGTTNWAANSSQLLNTVGFFMWANTVTEQLYFDDIVLVK